MPSTLTVGVAQCHTQHDLPSTLAHLRKHTESAAQKNVSILLFPEAFLGGYPRGCSFGAAIGSRTLEGREQFRQYYNSCVDLGDTSAGEGDAWLYRKLAVDETGKRGDGSREYLETVARETGVFLVVGMVERGGGSLFCAALYVDPVKGVVGKRRKVMPTASERLVWAQGQPSTLKAIKTEIKGVKVVMGAAICWENYMPLLRYALYAQGVNLWLAPTADPRPTWEPLCKTIAFEGRCWVVTGNQCIKRKDLPDWVTGQNTQAQQQQPPKANGEAVPLAPNGDVPLSPTATGRRRSSMTTKTEENHEIAWRPKLSEPTYETDSTTTNTANEAAANAANTDFASVGGSCIISPLGETVAGPIWNSTDELLYAEIDFDECERGKLDFDATGHYSRGDAFKLTVEGLDLTPPP